MRIVSPSISARTLEKPSKPTAHRTGLFLVIQCPVAMPNTLINQAKKVLHQMNHE